MRGGASGQGDTPPTRVKTVCVMGAGGFIGQALCATLAQGGITVHRYSRAARPGFHTWEPATGHIDLEPLRSADAVVNLAGEDIAGARWNEARKQLLRDSRVASTQLIARTLSQLDTPPAVLINASAVGYYGHRGEEAVFEHSAPGVGFLPEVCEAWEEAALSAEQAGIRVVFPRFGIVLSPYAGALPRIVAIFKRGLGGRLGSGTQFMPWIALSDAVAVIRYLIRSSDVYGPVNAVAPEAVTNEIFTEVLGHVLNRPTLLPVPSFALRLALGELSQVLLEGANVRPEVLEQIGFRFDYPRLEDALSAMLV